MRPTVQRLGALVPLLGTPLLGTPLLGTPLLGTPLLGTPLLGTPLLGTLLVGSLLVNTVHCAAQPVPPASEPEPPAIQRRVSFHLRDASVQEALDALSAAAGKPLVVAPDAQPIVRCAHLTLLTPEPVPIGTLADLTSKSLDQAGLALHVEESGWIVRRSNGATPADCASCPRAPSGEPAPVPAAGDETEAVSTETILEGIRPIGENSYEITAKTLDALLENQAILARDARIVPYQKDGRIAGFRLLGIRPHGVMHALGFKNGDRLDAINGHPLTSPEQALDAYATLRRTSKIEVHITRRGKTMRLHYLVERP